MTASSQPNEFGFKRLSLENWLTVDPVWDAFGKSEPSEWVRLVKFYRGSRPMNQSVTYRQNAAECYEAARILSDPSQKAKLLAMAQSWISLADLAERNSHLDRIDETPPRRESHIHWGN
jgi:hypothetical protein